jgi:hypothetical protein
VNAPSLPKASVPFKGGVIRLADSGPPPLLVSLVSTPGAATVSGVANAVA